MSSASLGFVVALAKAAAGATFGSGLLAAIVLLLASAVIAIVIARPRMHQASGASDLFDLYQSHMANYGHLLWWWFGLWLLGAAAGVLSVRW